MKIWADKKFLSADTFLYDTFCLARRVLDSAWCPDDLVTLWRGGAMVGVALHEFFHFHGVELCQHVLQCRSYQGIGQQAARITVENVEPLLQALRPGRRVLIVDDIFDSGRTAQRVVELLKPAQVEVRLAMVYWKPQQNLTRLLPDYYVHQTEEWIVFPHEIVGLSAAELRSKNPDLTALLAH